MGSSNFSKKMEVGGSNDEENRLVEAFYKISDLFEANLDRTTIAAVISLLQKGVHPESLADVGLPDGESSAKNEKMESFAAGRSMNYCPPVEGLRENNTWSQCDANSFHLRIGPNYDWNKLKGPSPPALMEIVGVDCYRTPSRLDNFGARTALPEEWLDRNTHHPLIPSLFIVNVQIPEDFSTSFFFETTDGPGWTLVLYFRITEETCHYLSDLSTAPPAVKLFADYCMHAPEAEADSRSPWRGRFKITLRCNNIEEFGLPSFITSYNAKPVLIRHTGTLLRGERAKYVEMDINVHRFAALPKKALEILITRFDKMFISVGFCIESRRECEMPETMFGCVDLNQPQVVWPFWDPSVVDRSRRQKSSQAGKENGNSSSQDKSGKDYWEV